MVTLATAHAAKFPDAVEAACGERPELPNWVGDLMQRTERKTVLPNDLSAIESYIADSTRAVRRPLATKTCCALCEPRSTVSG